MSQFEGKIYRLNKWTLAVDAEPHVMSRIRKIFDNAKTLWEQGQYTHKIISFSDTLVACRDLIWLMDRYSFDISPDLLTEIQAKSKEYDDILRAVSDADKDTQSRISTNAIPLALPLREHQMQFQNMFRKMKRMLLADCLGLGKTASAISLLQEPESRPALIVVPAHLCTQWDKELKRFLPSVTTCIIKGFKTYDLPKVDVVITSYNRLGPWQDILLSPEVKFRTLIMDEVHELRHTDTVKRHMCKDLSKRVDNVAGLSATPIFNNGSEIYSVLDVIKPGCLGDQYAFESEWCSFSKVYEPATLNSFLKKQGLFLRRSPEQIGLKFGEVSKQIYTIDSDIEALNKIQDVAKLLALSVLSGRIGEDSESAKEFDWKLRHATGVAKAKPTAEFVKMLVESGEKVLLAGWHRDVYSVWEKEFKGIKTVMYTGSESTKEKDQAIKDFTEGDAQVFIISLRSGSGIDGLQKVCSTVVIGELDWSPHVMDQVIGRLARDGQAKHVQAYYLTIPDGADPFMIEVLGVKRSQHDGVIEGKISDGEVLKDTVSKDRIRQMAAAYLESIGEEIPVPVVEEGLLGEVAKLMRKTKLPNSTEEEMQEALHKILKVNIDSTIGIEREFKLSKRSRLDFLLTKDHERVAIECKIESTDRAGVYRQVRKYAQEGNITSLVLVAPWFGIPSFVVDGIPVIVVDTNVNSI